MGSFFVFFFSRQGNFTFVFVESWVKVTLIRLFSSWLSCIPCFWLFALPTSCKRYRQNVQWVGLVALLQQFQWVGYPWLSLHNYPASLPGHRFMLMDISKDFSHFGWITLRNCMFKNYFYIWILMDFKFRKFVTCDMYLPLTVHIYTWWQKKLPQLRISAVSSANLRCQPGYGASLEIRPKLLVLPGSRASHLAVCLLGVLGNGSAILMVDFCWGCFGKNLTKQHLLLTKRVETWK